MKKIILYRCNPDKNPKCTKTGCGWLKNGAERCFMTSEKGCAELNENGEPIIEEILKEGVDFSCGGSMR